LQETTPSIPARTPVRSAILLAASFATLTFLIHLVSSLWGSHIGYGFFRDELYFLICGRHLAWGYIDQPPLAPLQARLAELLFGLSPTGIRIFSFAAAGITVGLTGLLAWQLGSRRTAQALAMTAVLAAPAFLATSNYLSMNSWEPCFWMGSLLALMLVAGGTAGARSWLLFGLLAGLAIENKHSAVFFLIALLIGLLLSPQRRILWSKGCAAGVALLILIALPNLIWQWVHHFPTYELLSNVAHSDKNVKLPPLAFLAQQVNMLLIFAAPLWIGGLAWFALARNARPWRFLALTYLVFLAMMMAMHAKDYYLVPIYPVLFAGGAVALAALTRRLWPLIAYTALLGFLLVFVSAPMVLTILPPDKYVAYSGHLVNNKVKNEKFTSPLPQFLSDRFGWPQMVQGFSVRYNALPPDERARTAIFCHNYGEASAVNILGPKLGLPTAISGHQNYFYWGWNNYTGESVLTLGDHREDYTDSYAEVIDLGAFDAPWIMDFEHHHYFWLRHRKRPYAADWPQFKFWY
jgi:MFS family permease